MGRSDLLARWTGSPAAGVRARWEERRVGPEDLVVLGLRGVYLRSSVSAVTKRAPPRSHGEGDARHASIPREELTFHGHIRMLIALLRSGTAPKAAYLGSVAGALTHRAPGFIFGGSLRARAGARSGAESRASTSLGVGFTVL